MRQIEWIIRNEVEIYFANATEYERMRLEEEYLDLYKKLRKKRVPVDEAREEVLFKIRNWNFS